MRYNAALLLLLTICSLAGCAKAQQPTAETTLSKPDRKVLIVYLSRTNNTKAVAEFINDEVGGTLVPLELEKPYPEDYRTTVEQVARENETGYLPPLKTKIDRIEQYDTVFVGFPTWGCNCRRPLRASSSSTT